MLNKPVPQWAIEAWALAVVVSSFDAIEGMSTTSLLSLRQIHVELLPLFLSERLPINGHALQ